MNDCEAEAEDDRRWSTNSDEEFVQRMDSRMALEASQQETEAAEKLVPRVRWRILPMLWVLSFVSYIDRANLAYVSLKMNRELGFDTTTYGIGAALFFVGYVGAQIPSNLMVVRFGCRRWLACIIFAWGVSACAMSLIRTKAEFYALRLVLGTAEAGFFPGLIVYMKQWFGSQHFGLSYSIVITATSVSGVLGAPIAALLMSLGTWKMLFLVEGLPAIVLSVVWFGCLPADPSHARFLTANEQVQYARLVDARRPSVNAEPRRGVVWRRAVVNRSTWTFALTWAGVCTSYWSIIYFLPLILDSMLDGDPPSSLKPFNTSSVPAIAPKYETGVRAEEGATDHSIASVLYSAVPYATAVAGNLLNAWHSDKTGERRWHTTGAILIGGSGLALAAVVGHDDGLLSLAALSVAAAGIWGVYGPLFSSVTSICHPSDVAMTSALVNSIGNIGGFVGPIACGAVRDATKSYATPLALMAGMQAITAVAFSCCTMGLPSLGGKESAAEVSELALVGRTGEDD